MLLFIAFLHAVLWPAVAVYAIWRLAPVLVRFAPAPVVPSHEDVLVPEDVMAYIMSFDDDWAKEDSLRAARERYAESKNWNTVRSAFGLAHRSDA